MTSPLKRVSEPTADTITAIAEREGRTFVAQLDRIVDAGLAALGETVPNRTPDPAPAPTPKATAPVKAASRPRTRGKAAATA